MAKMFYTLGEVCEKLGKSEDEVKGMVSSGEIQEFRDGESLVFKVEQIDLLAAPDDVGSIDDLDLHGSSLGLDDSFDLGASATGASSIGLASSQSASSGGTPTPAPTKMPTPPPVPPPVTPPAEAKPTAPSEQSGSVMGLEGSSMMPPATAATPADDLDLSAEMDAASPAGSGGSVSAFDSALDLDQAGDTRLGEGFDDDLTLESVGSGSGLLDLTRESDDTSLGAELLEEVYSSDYDAEEIPHASGLFEAATGAEAEPGPAVAGAAPAPSQFATATMVAEAWDPAWSGLTVGMMIGAAVSLIAVFAMVVVEVQGGASGIAEIIGESIWVWVGGLAGGTAVAAVLGMVLGRRAG